MAGEEAGASSMWRFLSFIIGNNQRMVATLRSSESWGLGHEDWLETSRAERSRRRRTGRRRFDLVYRSLVQLNGGSRRMTGDQRGNRWWVCGGHIYGQPVVEFWQRRKGKKLNESLKKAQDLIGKIWKSYGYLTWLDQGWQIYVCCPGVFLIWCSFSVLKVSWCGW